MTKKDIIQLLEKIATYMELKGENTFKVSAYRKAAQSLEMDERTLDEIEDVTELKGIGKGVGEVIDEYRQSGQSSALEALQKEVPEGLIPLLKIQGLGSKKIAKLYKELNIDSKEALQVACEQGKVSELSGFAKKTEQNILEAVKALGAKKEKYPIDQIRGLNSEINGYLATVKDIDKYEVAGSYRRYKEMSKDLDYIISTDHPTSVQQSLLKMPNIVKQVAVGQTKVSLELAYDDETIGVDFRLIEPAAFYHTLQHFTGSKDHNIRIRQLAKEQDEKVSEYGIEQNNGEIIQYQSEKEIYEHFGVNWIEPALREDGSEFDKNLDNIIKLTDIHGDIHMHTTYSDGAFSIEDMVKANIEKGYEFMVITDHSQSLKVANGLSVERLLRQNEEIKALNEKYKEIDIYSGIEMDILSDGQLDYDDEILAKLDYVIAAIHQSFNQSQEEIMRRLENACRNPYVRHIAHPTGRIIGKRPGYEPDIDKLCQLAEETNTILEINANPKRLDLNADTVKKHPNIQLTINTDAHHVEHLEFMKYGVATAQKGFVTKDRVINTMSREEFKSFVENNIKLKK
ncbi:DNA polymerase/3'-5' exonuclease PolX [Staphylococcus saprophyticus]|jgi:DNA polymerase (family 10)|uniref:DNA polymerase/3'-5' exonuclease PolX n=1 Tax=Staphylococcus saprophyticus TaxID=29385 RepID=UPI001642EF0C|nr:DNA polymerase/3'-5' exonuclease PolX [Staphylococcus saprophyticus]MBC2921153.1 DNA polymerase/3'-5' exonuclease PolX [Staphylococcus saprophyticus]MBC2956858.1 DNA polymerase/3'-5' exonuclease PolX [Staphylococcus saprophyticus]MBC3009020.1 DNA polymerase/3'-5' exonuclease PolX [Staphylococcus saprophyticus]MBC3022899.1 DNA polymerase/3'-5' exonuclease PolX [Staphylococcus saprophyticus]MBC3029842.1 DNA polymerase/3'-5' exonuclease PolX [Staphylococcus saprophyticus]